jgi:hypothetical protein
VNSFITEDNDLLIWAYAYLQKARIGLSRYSPFDNPISCEDLYRYVLLCLDTLYYQDSRDYKLLTIQMRKALSQKIFREADKTKVKYHIPLTKEAKKQLDELTDYHGVKSNNLLERLIKQEYQSKLLDENGKKKY